MSEPETAREAHARGQKEGRMDALLAEHSEHLAKINGSIERAALAEEALEKVVASLDVHTQDALRKLEVQLKLAIANVASDVRTLNEDARLRDERVSVAARTLATETERRRTELADTASAGSNKFTRRQQIAALALTVIGLGLSALVIYLSLHH